MVLKDLKSPLSIIAIVLTLVGIILRITGSFGDLWLDEIWALQAALSLESPAAMFSPGHLDGHASLYTLVMYYLGEGLPSFVYRLPAVLCGLGSLYCLYLLYLKRGRSIALLTVMLSGLSFPLVLYSSEARGYAPMILCGLLCLMMIERYQKPFSFLLYIFFCILGFLFHLSFVQLYAALGIWSFFFFIKEKGALSKAVLLFLKYQLVPALFVISSWFLFIRNLPEGTGPLGSHLEAVINSLAVCLGLPVLSPLQPDAMMAMLVVLIFFLVIMLRELLRLRKEKGLDALFYLVMIFVVPAVCILALKPRVLLPRYFLMSMVFVAPLLATYIINSFQRNRLSKALSALVLIIYCGGHISYLTVFASSGRGQYLNALSWIAEEDSSEEILLSSDQDFRNNMMIEFFASDISGRKFRYIESDKVKEDLPKWYLVHSQDWGFSPEEKIDVADNNFLFKKGYGSAALSGWSWYLYQREE